jgi:hypothetical protein
VNVCETLKYVKTSTSRKEKFQFTAEQAKTPDISLVSHVPTKWNSTYDMLETTVRFGDAFVRLQERDMTTHTSFAHLMIIGVMLQYC